MDVSPYRRAYFALAKSLGLNDDMRHEFNLRLTRKASSTLWSVDDWRLAVAELQRLNGQAVKPGQPHISGARSRAAQVAVYRDRGGRHPSDPSDPSDHFISAAQLEFISSLAGAITWRAAPEAFIRARLLHPFRKNVWDGKIESLTRREAESVITAFKRMAGFYAAKQQEAAR